MENQLAINPETVSSLIQAAPEILKKNELSVSKCNAAGKALLDTIEAEGGHITSDELDDSVKAYLEKVKVTIEGKKEEKGGEKTGGMYNRRKPVTQLLNAIAKRFTSLENEIDPKNAGTVPYKLQILRDRYAAGKLAEQRKREEEARRKKLAEDEKNSYRADVAKMLDDAYEKYAGETKSRIMNIYSGVTTGNYSESLNELNRFTPAFVWAEYVKGVKDSIATSYIDAETRMAIKQEVAKARKAEYERKFQSELLETKESLLERMPSKRKALEEEAELRRRDAAAASEAEAARKKREAEEAARAEAERKREEEARKAQAEAAQKTAEAMTALGFMSGITPEMPVNAKVTRKIQVLNPKGFIEIYQLWFMKEGINLPMTDLEKIHKKMIAFCEKEANRDGGTTLKSAFVQYVDDVKAK
jgi:hypothetical protein